MMPESFEVPRMVEILTPPEKSDSDQKDYRTIKLQNGLIATLVSDPTQGLIETIEPDETTERVDEEVRNVVSAASLSIRVGSFQDPDEFPGLAHFLEHMVSMGSEKYPDENDFSSFITKHGGYENANTNREYSNFYFSVQPHFLREALDKFAQFFIAPLLTKDLLQREREAIESEFNLGKTSNANRVDVLLFSLAKQGHPVRKFQWGNIDTLGGNAGERQKEKDNEVYEALHQFRRQYYTARSMRLAIQSRHSLDVLQNWVVEYFSPIIPGNVPIRFENTTFPFDTPEFFKFYHVSPVFDVKELTLRWTLPSMESKYEYKPEEYLSHIMGDEGRGSLSKYLRDNVWALNLEAGCADSNDARNSAFFLFELNITLTDEGVEHLAEVLESIFSFIAMMKHEGPQEWIFEEKKSLTSTKFKFEAQNTALNYVPSLSVMMFLYRPEHYISGRSLFFKYDPHLISECLSYLTPERVNIVMLNKNSTQIYDHTEHWFGTPYTFHDIPAEWMERWKKAEPRPEFALPRQNEYLTTDFSLLDSCDNCDPNAPPERVQCDGRGELWFKQDRKFKLPIAKMNLQLISPLITCSPVHKTCCELIYAIVEQNILEETFPSIDAGYQISGNVGVYSIQFSVNGFNDKLPLLLGTVIKHFVEFENEVTVEQFNAIKENRKEYYRNQSLHTKHLMQSLLDTLLATHTWTILDGKAAIDDVTLDMLKNFSRKLRGRLYVKALMQGNITKQQAMMIMAEVQAQLDYKPLIPNTYPRLRSAQVEIGSRVCRVASFNTNSSNSLVSHFFFCGLQSISQNIAILAIMPLLREAAFDTLRTKEQLAYTVQAGYSLKRGVYHIYIHVENQEDKHTADYVDARIWEFLKMFESRLAALNEVEFQQLIESCKEEVMKSDMSLQEELITNWFEIISNDYKFNRKQLYYEALNNISLPDILDWYKKNVLQLKSTTRHLSLQVKGFSEREESPEVSNVSENEEMREERIEQPEVEESAKPKIIENICDSKDFAALCVPNPLRILRPKDNGVSKPITNIEEYRSSLFYYPAMGKHNY